jgi:hypothetical protein
MSGRHACKGASPAGELKAAPSCGKGSNASQLGLDAHVLCSSFFPDLGWGIVCARMWFCTCVCVSGVCVSMLSVCVLRAFLEEWGWLGRVIEVEVEKRI